MRSPITIAPMSSSSNPSSALRESIGIMGSGAAGLISAHVLLKDGFEDVTIVSKDLSVGGVWARERIYPGLQINNVHGEYRFSALDMASPDSTKTGQAHLTGEVMCNYMETLSTRFLENKAKFRLQTEIMSIRRAQISSADLPSIWHVEVRDVPTGRVEVLIFNRIILATGCCHTPSIPNIIHPDRARDVGYRGLILHSSEFGQRYHEVTKVARSNDHEQGEEDARSTVVVIGGGKSAQDICAQLAKEGCKTVIVFEKVEAFSAARRPPPESIRRSRFMSTIMPYHTPQNGLERFLHTTTTGSKLVHSIASSIVSQSLKAYNIPSDSPLRLSEPIFWGGGLSDAGIVRPDSFQALVRDGTIQVYAPNRVSGYSADGSGVLLDDGTLLPGKVIILATGYRSSWPSILSAELMAELGMDKHSPTAEVVDKWNFASLQGGPAVRPEDKTWVTSIHRGLVPARNILNRDFAIAGSLFTANFGYTNEVAAHWISSYFRGDRMRLPETSEDAILEAEKRSAWAKFRYPILLRREREGNSTSVDNWTWPQAADELLEDMYLPSQRSGGNWLTRPFKVIDSNELRTLSDERRALLKHSQCSVP